MTMKERMTIICTGALGHDAFVSMALPQAMRDTALIFFLQNNQSSRAMLLRIALKQLNETGVIS